MNKIVFLIAIALLTGCGTNYSIPQSDKDEAISTKFYHHDDPQNLITFRVNGEEVQTTGWAISRLAWKSDVHKVLMNITSNMHEDKRTFNVNLQGAVPGNYPLGRGGSGQGKSYGSYYPDYIDDQLNSFYFASGAFNITAVDTLKNKVNGIFYGTAKNLKGDSVEITDGKIINGILSPGITYY